MPSASVKPLGKATIHLLAVTRLGPAAFGSARVDRNDGRSDAQLLAAYAMMFLRVVTAVAQQSVNGQMRNRLSNRGQEVGRIMRRTVPSTQRGDQVTGVMADHGQLGIAAIALCAARTRQKMSTDVMAFKTRCIDRRFCAVVD